MNKGMRKIQEMNAMKRELKERGVSIPRGTDYPKLKALYNKHAGGGAPSACSLAGKALQSCGDKDRAKRQTQQVLFGFTF